MNTPNHCRDCSGISEHGKSRCTACLKRVAAYVRKYYKQLLDKGLCRCLSPVIPGKKRCKDCAAQSTSRALKLAATRKSNGQCLSCGAAPVSGRKQCRKCLEYWNTRAKTHHTQARAKVLQHYGARCACCGISKLDYLTVDHKNGGGRAHKKNLGAGSIYQWLINHNFPESFQILCANCNCGRALNGGVCPHADVIEVETHDIPE